MKHIIPARDWAIALADAIRAAQSGDSIQVDSEDKKELGEIARRRICPEKEIEFVVVAWEYPE